MGYTLPKGQSAYKALPNEPRQLVDMIAEEVRGLPWLVIYAVGLDIKTILQAALDSDPDIFSPEQYNAAVDNANGNIQVAIAALLERLGAKPTKVKNPFQARLYSISARREFQKAAKPYIRSIGGAEKLHGAMAAWADTHPEELEQIPERTIMPGETIH